MHGGGTGRRERLRQRRASGGVAITEVGICDSTALGALDSWRIDPSMPLLHFNPSGYESGLCSLPMHHFAQTIEAQAHLRLGARIAPCKAKTLCTAIAFLKSLGIIHEIFSPSDRSTSSGAISHPFFT